jgi:hypothetical protein
MVKDDVLFGYRLQLFAEAQRTSVSAACRVFGVPRSTSSAFFGLNRGKPTSGFEPLFTALQIARG